ncbi:hypothetical protein BUALT_Bualt01G0126400 [Buddleja alternifolia]|uniref:Uncharacterized protein n=1 Tax=Buddleja alternifolia TaxID=168488 RepID=A0AAV6Y7M5_9LAMI|nr:hypothetical protein BUALT_Bualt01G0126400 [Buddleja alternifolia]
MPTLLSPSTMTNVLNPSITHPSDFTPSLNDPPDNHPSHKPSHRSFRVPLKSSLGPSLGSSSPRAAKKSIFDIGGKGFGEPRMRKVLRGLFYSKKEMDEMISALKYVLPSVHEIWLEDDNGETIQRIVYENIPIYCPSCKLLGHSEEKKSPLIHLKKLDGTRVEAAHHQGDLYSLLEKKKGKVVSGKIVSQNPPYPSAPNISKSSASSTIRNKDIQKNPFLPLPVINENEVENLPQKAIVQIVSNQWRMRLEVYSSSQELEENPSVINPLPIFQKPLEVPPSSLVTVNVNSIGFQESSVLETVLSSQDINFEDVAVRRNHHRSKSLDGGTKHGKKMSGLPAQKLATWLILISSASSKCSL